MAIEITGGFSCARIDGACAVGGPGAPPPTPDATKGGTMHQAAAALAMGITFLVSTAAPAAVQENEPRAAAPTDEAAGLAVPLMEASVPAETASPMPLRLTAPDPIADGLVAEALRNNVDVARGQAEVEAALLRVDPARTLPDPSFGYTLQNEGYGWSVGSNEGSFVGMMYTQALPFPGKRGLAGRIAESEAFQVRSALPPRIALSLEARVRRAYYDLLNARAQLDLIDDRQRTWQQIEGVVRERYAVGLGEQQDLLRTQIELVRLDESRAGQEAIVTAKLAELNRLVQRPQETPVGTGPALRYNPDLPRLDQVISAVLERSPELAASREAINASGLRVDLAKLQFLPDFVVSGGPMLRGSMTPMWQAGVGISLPIYYRSRQQKRLEEAQALRRSSEALQTSLGLELELRTRERAASLTATQRVLRVYKDGVLPLDQLSLDAALASYRTGKLPFVTVLEALNALYADRALYLTRLAEAEKWRVAIDEADLQPTAGMSAPSGGMSAALSTPNMNASSSEAKSAGAMQ